MIWSLSAQKRCGKSEKFCRNGLWCRQDTKEKPPDGGKGEQAGMTREEEYYRQKYLAERRYSRMVEKIAQAAFALVIVTVLILAITHGGAF